MACRLLVPWWTYPLGHVLDLGETFDNKMIAKGKAEKVDQPRKAVVRPKEKPNGSA